MNKIIIAIIALFLVQACKRKEVKPKLACKKVLQLDNGINSNFGFTNNSIFIDSWAYNNNEFSWNDCVYSSSGLYKPYYDSIVIVEKLYNNPTINIKSFKKTMQKCDVYISNIYKYRFNYDVIADSFDLLPSGRAMAKNVVNKSIGNTSSAVYQFSKKENIYVLKSYKNYWIYLKGDSSINNECKASLNILNTLTKQKCEIKMNFCVGQLSFLLFDIMNDEKPEIFLFYIPPPGYREAGELSIFEFKE